MLWAFQIPGIDGRLTEKDKGGAGMGEVKQKSFLFFFLNIYIFLDFLYII